MITGGEPIPRFVTPADKERAIRLQTLMSQDEQAADLYKGDTANRLAADAGRLAMRLSHPAFGFDFVAVEAMQDDEDESCLVREMRLSPGEAAALDVGRWLELGY